MNVKELFLDYVKIDSRSDENSGVTPSTPGQFDMAKRVVEDLKKDGVDATYNEKCYVYGSIPASDGRDGEPAIGLIAHIDTAPVISGKNIKPSIIEDYNGKDIILENKTVLSPDVYGHLKNYIGQSIIVTDGNTLLGADDKAGVAEIIAMADYIISNNISHPAVKIAFTPDEEIGCGADNFNVAEFGADYAYTVDGGQIGELEYENFNAASATVTICGNCIHPGEAKNKMKNAILMAMEFNAMLPPEQTPSHTEGYEGFYHLCYIEGMEEKTALKYIIRDHDRNMFERRKKVMENIAAYLNDKYGKNTVKLEIIDSYYNMKEKIADHMEIIDKARRAFEKESIPVHIQPIRGGTDGARLSYMGLPCPNLSAGGHNFHGKYEYIPVESMEKMVKVLVNLVTE